MSRVLVGVTLPIHLPGEDKAPCEQKGLSPEKLRAKEVQVFDKAIDELNDYSTGRKYDGFDIHPVAVKCDGDEEPYSDEAELQKFIHAGIREIEASYVDLLEELQFLVSHAVHSVSYLQFMKCEDATCPHCSQRPVKEELVKFLGSSGGSLHSYVQWSLPRPLQVMVGVQDQSGARPASSAVG